MLLCEMYKTCKVHRSRAALRFNGAWKAQSHTYAQLLLLIVPVLAQLQSACQQGHLHAMQQNCKFGMFGMPKWSFQGQKGVAFIMHAHLGASSTCVPRHQQDQQGMGTFSNVQAGCSQGTVYTSSQHTLPWSMESAPRPGPDIIAQKVCLPPGLNSVSPCKSMLG